MTYVSSTPQRRLRFVAIILVALSFFSLNIDSVSAHPLGNFTINHFTRIEVGNARVRVHYVVDMAEIPAFQELQAIGGKSDGSASSAELNAYLERVVAQYAAGLLLTVDGAPVSLRATKQAISLPQGAGGLPTLRVECDFEGDVPAGVAGNARRLRFEDRNHTERIGWREIVVVPETGITVYDSTAFGSALTDELRSYPQDMLAAPLDERKAELSWTTDAAPTGATVLRTRDGRPAEQSRDTFAELIAVKELTLPIALLGLLIAMGLGALHAFSPGHGKTVVGAYLVGSKGTAKHAAFLGLTVTITHTSTVFALGLITLFASQYFVPERLYPILGVISGAIVLVMGLSLFIKRLRAATGHAANDQSHHTHSPDGDHIHTHEHEAGESAHHDHAHDEHTHHSHDGAHTHTHGGSTHSHLPPGADGSRVTWRNLLALGISGGLLPCPSALVVLLSAITLNRVGYGLLLVLAFSIGLAATLTCIGLLFVYAGKFLKRPLGKSRLVRVLPVLSALVIACVGVLICYQALAQAGVNLNVFSGASAASSPIGEAGPSLTSLGAFAILGLGLLFGLKHATEVDHVVAVSTIVSEHRNVWRAALVGGLWGAGHTVSLILVGVVVLGLRIAVPELVASWLEFSVALMIIGLGIAALVRGLRRRQASVHLHRHSHDGMKHAHIHFHEDETEHAATEAHHSHAISKIGLKPFLVGAMHGLAGSAALTLLVLTQINSPMLGLLYLTVFGLGSIFGMLLMSSLVGLPFALSSRRVSGVSYGLQTMAGALSIAFGLWYAYETGIASGLLGFTL